MPDFGALQYVRHPASPPTVRRQAVRRAPSAGTPAFSFTQSLRAPSRKMRLGTKRRGRMGQAGRVASSVMCARLRAPRKCEFVPVPKPSINPKP